MSLLNESALGSESNLVDPAIFNESCETLSPFLFDTIRRGCGYSLGMAFTLSGFREGEVFHVSGTNVREGRRLIKIKGMLVSGQCNIVQLIDLNCARITASHLQTQPDLKYQ